MGTPSWRVISSSKSPSRSSRFSLAFAMARATLLLCRNRLAGEIETRFAMFRDGSPYARAFSISISLCH